jgi:hypothetical protein
MALRQRPEALPRIANALIDRAEAGDLASVCELIDRLDGKPPQSIDRLDVQVAAELTDAGLLVIAAGGRRAEDELRVIPPMPKD